MSKSNVNIIVDDREPAELNGMADEHTDVRHRFTDRLDVGDLVVEPDIGDVQVAFERKTPSDFASSVMGEERNIYDQLDRLDEAYDHYYILIEGDMGDFERLLYTEIPPKALRGAVASITARRCPVMFCSTPSGLIDTAIRLSRKHAEDPSTKHTPAGTMAGKSDASTTRQMLACCDGVGPQTAMILEDEFGSIERVLNATQDELIAVEGVGEKTARRIHESLGY